MWNYRVVRKTHIYTDPKDKKEKVDYTYAIHEAYYDNNGFVGAITQDPVEPFGEDIEGLRHSWVMMAEAFGQPVLEYDNIPEPGYEREQDPIGSVLDERLRSLETGTAETIPWEEVKRGLEERFGSFDEEAYRKRIEEERIEKELIHSKGFVGRLTLEKLIEKLCSDYQQHQREQDECIENKRQTT
jgi:hypothetical protein